MAIRLEAATRLKAANNKAWWAEFKEPEGVTSGIFHDLLTWYVKGDGKGLKGHNALDKAVSLYLEKGIPASEMEKAKDAVLKLAAQGKIK